VRSFFFRARRCVHSVPTRIGRHCAARRGVVGLSTQSTFEGWAGEDMHVLGHNTEAAIQKSRKDCPIIVMVGCGPDQGLPRQSHETLANRCDGWVARTEAVSVLYVPFLQQLCDTPPSKKPTSSSHTNRAFGFHDESTCFASRQPVMLQSQVPVLKRACRGRLSADLLRHPVTTARDVHEAKANKHGPQHGIKAQRGLHRAQALSMSAVKRALVIP
jgi:hypothetical protein